jgi:hypothetical protein
MLVSRARIFMKLQMMRTISSKLKRGGREDGAPASP